MPARGGNAQLSKPGYLEGGQWKNHWKYADSQIPVLNVSWLSVLRPAVGLGLKTRGDGGAGRAVSGVVHRLWVEYVNWNPRAVVEKL